MATPRGRRRPSGARESPLFLGGCYNQDILKDPKKRDDHLSVLYNKDKDVGKFYLMGGVLFDVARRRRLGPILAAGNIYVVLAGLLEHAMLPAEISSSGLKTLLLHGVRLIPGHLYTDGI